ncbi:MAG TPA: hypothetical protein VFY40_06640 [Blastocatellia bacterium]|nr:hypothetical protein [Blastocatellia bacterium]
MKTVLSSPQFVKSMGSPAQPSGSGFGYLLVAVMAISLIGTNAYGFAQATSLPPLIGLTVAILAFVIRMYMIRRRSAYERVASDGLERALFYLPAAILSTALSAFAIYCWVIDSETHPKRLSSVEKLEHATVALENYYHDVRAKIRSRLETIDERLREPDNRPLSESQTEIADLEEEQRTLRELFRETVAGVKPPATDDEGSIQEKLSRKFDDAAKLHQQLPESISNHVEAPMLESLPEDTASGGKLDRFFRDVMALTSEAGGCLAVPIILEIFIVILVVSNRPRE